MRASFLAIAGLITATYALPGNYGDRDGDRSGPRGGEGGRRGRGRGGRRHRGKYAAIEPVTTKFQYLCPTGVKEVETVVTELPEDNTSIGATVPGWSEYVTVCTACENPTEQVTLTLPPDVYPTGPESGPLTSEYDLPEETGAPEPTGTEEEPAEETGAEESNGDTGAESSYAGETSAESVPEETGTPSEETDAVASPTSVPEGETYTASEELPAPTGESSAAPSATTPAEEETYTDSTPEETAPATEESSAAASATSPGSETNYVIPNLPTVTPGEEAVTTRVGCTYTDIGEGGLVTRTVDIETEVPKTATEETYTISMTESVGVCTACGDSPQTLTLTVPAYETPAGEQPSEEPEAPETPVETAVETPVETSVETPAESSAAETGEESTPSETSPASSESTAYVPVIPNIPTPTPGEEVVTTKVACTFTSIGESGLTTATAEVTAEIPATATDVSYTISMTETVELCTVCGDTPTSVTLTVPVETAVETPEETPDNGNEEETPDNGNDEGGEETPDSGEDDSADVPTSTEALSTTRVGYVTSVPQVDIPVVSEGEAVYTTVIRTTYEDVCPTGMTTRTVDYTAEVPASISTELSYVMTTSTALCTKGCGAGATSVVVTVPVYSETTRAVSEEPQQTPVETPAVPVATTITRTRTATRPVYSAPTASAGEPVVTTVITKTYTTICPTGLSATTTLITATVPETYSDPIEIGMTTTSVLCTGCGTGSTVAIDVPAYEVTTEEAVETTVYIPETQIQTLTQTITDSAGQPAEETVVSIPGYAPVTQESQAYVIATETAYAAFPAASEDSASYVEYTLTTAYQTVGASGVEETTVTITAVATASPVLGESVYTTVCDVCASGEQTLTLTVPELTSTVTFYPTTLLASASASAGLPLAENSTTSGNSYFGQEPQQQEQEFQLTSGAEKKVVGWSVLAVAGIVGLMVM